MAHPRIIPGIASMALCALLAVPSTSGASPVPDDPEKSASQQGDGPRLAPDEDRRARVRSNRPDTIHAAFQAPPRFAYADERAALEAFERVTFPPGRAPASTIVTRPPEAWMRELALPELPIRWNEKTVAYLRFFRDDPKGRAMIRAWLRRKARYERLIDPILKEVDVPSDVIYVALAESGFDPTARSRVGAAGMWQFMEATGRVYGLSNTYWEDDRYDFERETWAAATYLRDLRARFGSWELALAAYNAGYGLVMTAMRRYNTNNFWALCEIESGLPYATTNYVPKIAAAAIVGANLSAFGIEDPVPGSLDPAAFVSVRLAPGTRLDDVANAIEADRTLVRELNARFVRGRVPPDGEPRLVRLPREASLRLETAAPELKAQAQLYATHRVAEGERLADIAAAHDLTEARLRRMNAVEDAAEIHAGLLLVVPASTQTSAAPSGKSLPSEETPPLVAVPSVEIPAGHRLLLVRTTRSMTPRSVSDAAGVGWQQVVSWNDLDPEARLLEGLWLQVVVPGSFDADAAGLLARTPEQVELVLRGSAEHLVAELARRGLSRRVYTAKKGDTLKRVARRFDLSVGSLGRINGFSRAHKLKVGEAVVVYVPDRLRKGTKPAPAPVSTALTREMNSLSQLEPRPGEDAAAPSRAPTTAETARLPGQRTSEAERTRDAAPEATRPPP